MNICRTEVPYVIRPTIRTSTMEASLSNPASPSQQFDTGGSSSRSETPTPEQGDLTGQPRSQSREGSSEMETDSPSAGPSTTRAADDSYFLETQEEGKPGMTMTGVNLPMVNLARVIGHQSNYPLMICSHDFVSTRKLVSLGCQTWTRKARIIQMPCRLKVFCLFISGSDCLLQELNMVDVMSDRKWTDSLKCYEEKMYLQTCKKQTKMICKCENMKCRNKMDTECKVVSGKMVMSWEKPEAHIVL